MLRKIKFNVESTTCIKEKIRYAVFYHWTKTRKNVGLILLM